MMLLTSRMDSIPAVLFVGDFFLPHRVFTVEGARERQVGHRGLRCGAVPVVDSGRTPDDIAGVEFQDLPVPRPGETDA